MSVRSNRVVAVFFIAACFQGGLTPLSACECDTTPPPCRAFWQSDVVFSGRVDTIEYVEAPAPEYSHYRVTFVVDLVLRGPSASQLVIKTASSGASCGYEFGEGESYIVYGYTRRGAIWTSRCDRTRPLSQAAEDLEYAAGLAGAGANGFIYGQLRRWDDYPGDRLSRETSAGWRMCRSWWTVWRPVSDAVTQRRHLPSHGSGGGILPRLARVAGYADVQRFL